MSRYNQGMWVEYGRTGRPDELNRYFRLGVLGFMRRLNAWLDIAVAKSPLFEVLCF
jgi:hypothetical protein